MKILKLKIKSPTNELIREIDFLETGLSFIYGDIKEPENLGATINSLGKTLLIKFIDYVFGANEAPEIVKPILKDYILEAYVKQDNKKYQVKRVIGNSKKIFVDGEPYDLTEYKDKFHIERRLYNKQLLLAKKAHEISPKVKNPGKDDYIDFLRMLRLDNLLEVVKNIYDSQDLIKQYKNNKKDLVEFYGNIDLKQIDEEIYFVDKEVERLSKKLTVISDKIKKIEITGLQKNVIEEYSQKSIKLKKIKRELERQKIECNRLQNFIDNSNKIDITIEHVLAIYEKAKQEVPEMIKRKSQEVEEFHRKVYEERKVFLNEKKTFLEKNIAKMEEDIIFLSEEIDTLGKVISMNQVYQESISLYEKYNKDLQELKYKQGKLSQIKVIDDKIREENVKLTNDFERANAILREYSQLIENYRDFIYDLVRSIYDEDIKTYFDIKVRGKHQKTRPIKFELTLKGDTGEGVGEVKKNLIDYLIFKYNPYLEILIQDSACYNGIDPRQVANMLFELSKITKETNKQAIVAINKYQLGEYEAIINFTIKNSSIILSENDKLLKFDFD